MTLDAVRALPLDRGGAVIRQRVQRINGTAEKLAHPRTARVGRKPLRGIAEHELITLFNGFAAFEDFGDHVSAPSATRQSTARSRSAPDSTPAASSPSPWAS